jgi:hypothetical protein
MNRATATRLKARESPKHCFIGSNERSPVATIRSRCQALPLQPVPAWPRNGCAIGVDDAELAGAGQWFASAALSAAGGRLLDVLILEMSRGVDQSLLLRSPA